MSLKQRQFVRTTSEIACDGNPESLLRAFHGPFPKWLESAYREAMNIFFQDALKYSYFFTLDELALAEAWLKALQTDRRRTASRALETPS